MLPDDGTKSRFCHADQPNDPSRGSPNDTVVKSLCLQIAYAKNR